MQSDLVRLGGSALKVAHYRKFQNYETVKGGCIPSKNKFKTQKYIKLMWLASDINFKRLHTGCSIAHEETQLSDHQTVKQL